MPDTCTFCDRPRNEVRHLVQFASKGLFICNRCLDDAQNTIQQMGEGEEPSEERTPLQKPREIKAYLDDYVISQDHTKKDIAVAVYNHFKRREALRSGFRPDVEIQKSNIMILGPTGCGKTQVARSVARLLRVPFYVGDATKLTMTGYVGDDVESLLQGLLATCEGDVERAQWGIVFLDESDKMARKSGRGASGFRDVTGEGVQQSLLKLVEGSQVRVPQGSAPMGLATNHTLIDTTNILFIFAGSFAGIEEIVKARVNKDSKVGFGASVRRDLTDAEVYRSIEEADILEFGIIPELLGRIPVHTSVLPLTEDEMVRILTEPKDAIIRQFQALFEMDGIDLQFDPDALKAIGREAISRPTGARALRSIVERVVKEYAYECPSDPEVKAIQITQDAVEGKAGARVSREALKSPETLMEEVLS